MASIDQATFVMKLLKQRHDELIIATKVLVKEMASEDAGKKKQANLAVLQKARDLTAVVPAEAVPEWLKGLEGVTDKFSHDSINSAGLLLTVISLLNELNSYQWITDTGDGSAFDFDAIFERYKNESRLPELFDEIVKLLQDMHASGDIEVVQHSFCNFPNH